jgi:putative ABC transport system permease protein
MLYVAATIGSILAVTFVALGPFFLLLFCGEMLLTRFAPGRPGRFVLIVVKNLRRNPLRTGLTFLATFVLVFVVTVVWSVLYYLDAVATEQTKDLKVIVTEKWQLNSQMPFAYARPLGEGAVDPPRAGEVRPEDSMTWQIYAGSLSPDKQTREDLVGFIAMEPRKILTMLKDVFDDFSPDRSGQSGKLRPDQIRQLEGYVEAMEKNKRAVLMGMNRLKAINKKVGERFSLYGRNYAGIDLDFEIVGVFPPGRFNELAVMNRTYLNDALDAYPRTHGGGRHPLADRSLNLVWLRVPDQPAFNQLAQQIEASPLFGSPPVKCQTLSAEIATVLEAYKDLIWGMRWLLAPSILGTMALVLSNAISISVRERRGELALLKVLGFRPGQILALVVGESVSLGAVAGLLSALFSYLIIDKALTDYNTSPVHIPESALWWGPAVGGLGALAGSVIPAWSACKVKVSQVFSGQA